MPSSQLIVGALLGTNSIHGPWFKPFFFEHILDKLALCGGGGNLISRLAIKRLGSFRFRFQK